MNSSYVKKFLTIIIVIAVVILFHFLGWLRPVENVVRRVIQPGSQVLYNLNIKIKENNLPFSSAEEFVEAYNTLSKDIEIVQQKAVQFERTAEENAELREQLKFFTRVSYEHIGAEVTGKNIEPLGNTLVLSRGKKDGVQEGDPVVAQNGILVGKIFRVEEDVSIARLINDPQSKIAATVMNQDKSIGLVEGGYGISVRMNFIPQNEQIVPGDIVVTSGLEKEVPKGLIVGTIQTVEKEAYEPFQRAVLTPGVPLDKISVVSIILQPPESSL